MYRCEHSGYIQNSEEEWLGTCSLRSQVELLKQLSKLFFACIGSDEHWILKNGIIQLKL